MVDGSELSLLERISGLSYADAVPVRAVSAEPVPNPRKRAKRPAKQAKPDTITSRVAAQYKRRNAVETPEPVTAPAHQQAELGMVLSGKAHKLKRRRRQAKVASAPAVVGVVSPQKGIEQLKSLKLAFSESKRSRTSLTRRRTRSSCDDEPPSLWSRAASLPSDFNSQDATILYADASYESSQHVPHTEPSTPTAAEATLSATSVQVIVDETTLESVYPDTPRPLQFDLSGKSSLEIESSDPEESILVLEHNTVEVLEISDSDCDAPAGISSAIFITSSPSGNAGHPEGFVATYEHQSDESVNEFDVSAVLHSSPPDSGTIPCSVPTQSVTNLADSVPGTPGEAVDSVDELRIAGDADLSGSSSELLEVPESPGHVSCIIYDEAPSLRSPTTKYESMSMGELRSLIAEWGFKPVRGRQAMLEVIRQCVESKQAGPVALPAPTGDIRELLFDRISSELRTKTEALQWWERILCYEPLQLVPFHAFLKSIGLDIDMPLVRAWCDRKGVGFTEAVGDTASLEPL